MRTRQLRETNQQLLETERELRQSETRFKAAAHATADVILEIDLKSLGLTWFGDVDAQLGYEHRSRLRLNATSRNAKRAEHERETMARARR